MTWIITLFVVGLIMLGFEVFLPGGILGALGGLSLLGACLQSYLLFGVSGAFLSLIAALILVAALLWYEFKLFPKTRLGKRLFLQKQVSGRSQPRVADATEVVGKTAKALTVLAPSGYVDVGGKRYEAFSRAGHISREESLVVVAVETFRLIVDRPDHA